MGNSAAERSAAKAAAERKAQRALELQAAADKAAADKAAADKLAADLAAQAELNLCKSLSVASKETGVSLVKKEVSQKIDSEFRSLSAGYKALLKNRDEAIRFLEVRGQKINPNALHQILFAQNMKMFKAFLTDKQGQKETFSGSEMLSILSRAVATNKKAIETRSQIASL